MRELLARHGIEPSRALGQNFVVDTGTIERIVRTAGVGPGDDVVEIGPGVGSLTVALADAGASVTAIELDRHLLPVLDEVLAGRDVDIVRADATDVEWAEVLDPTLRWKMVSNLPYNVGTTILLSMLTDAPQVTEMTVMVQHEVPP